MASSSRRAARIFSCIIPRFRGSLPADEDIRNLDENYSRMFLQENRDLLAKYGYDAAKYIQDNWDRLHEK